MMKPFQFQEECIQEVIDRFDGRSMIAAEMGLGKTMMALTVAHRLEAWPLVVVCPASIKWTWEQEAKKALGKSCLILEGRKASPILLGRRKIVIINYDILTNWVEHLRALKPQCIILDECQFCASPKTKRTKAVRQLCQRIKRVLALSGTPLVNRPMELFPILNLLVRKSFPSRWKFGMRYCGAKKTFWGWDFKGSSHIDELHKLLLESCMVRRRKADVLTDLPPKIRQVHPLPMRKPEEYRMAVDNFLEWLGNIDPKKAKKAAKAETLVQTSALISLAARLKLRAAVDWINEFLRDNPKEKLVVFGIHRKMIEALERRIEFPSVRIDGSTSQINRKIRVEQFQNGAGCRVLIGNIQAAGIGITLTAASRVVFTELSWRPGDHIQAEDRCHRLTQTGTVWVHYLVAHDSIEEKLCSVIQSKQKTLSRVLDGGKMEEDLDVFDQLLRELKK